MTVGESIRNDSTVRRHLALVALCLAQFGVVLGFQGTAVSLPEIERGLNLSVSSSQWLIGANALAYGGLLLPAGRAADLFGHRRMFIVGSTIFAIASLAAGLAPSFELLIAARVLQGAGTAISTPAMFALLADIFAEGTERRRALAFWGAAGPLGGVGAVLLGGAMAEVLGWRAVFLLGAPITLPALIFARSIFPDSHQRLRGRLDPLGALTGAVGIGVLVYSLGKLSNDGAISPIPLALLMGGLGLLGVFIAIERRSDSPLIPPSLLRERELVRAIAVAAFQGAATNTPMVFYSLFMQELRGLSAWETGLGFIPCNLAIMVGSVIGARMAGRSGFRLPMGLGMGIVAVGLVTMVTVSLGGSFFLTLLPGLVLLGTGLGIAQVAVIGAATGAARMAERGAAGGLVNAAAQIGTALGLAALVTVSNRASGDIQTVRVAFVGAGVFALLGCLAAFTPFGFRRVRSIALHRT